MATKDEALKMAIEALNEYPVSTSKLIVALEACMDVIEKCECEERKDWSDPRYDD